MFGRRNKKLRKSVIHTAECVAVHEAMLMSLYFGYGAPSAPLFIPTGSLVCTCGDDDGGGGKTDEVVAPIESTYWKMQRTLVTV